MAWRRPIKTDDLRYDLPPELIAQHPCRRRDAAKLLVLDRGSGAMEHRTFSDVASLLRPGDALVLNETQVLPARFVARRRTGGRIDGLFVEESGPGRWTVLLSGAGRLSVDETLILEPAADIPAVPGSVPAVGQPNAGAGRTLTLLKRLARGACEVLVEPSAPAAATLNRIGATPLPPYIRRSGGGDEPADRADYQTVYASRPGAVAAPTAGLHFTEDLLERIRRGGVTIARLVLHVGPGTFLPVEVEDLADHPMHSEAYELTEETAETLRRTRRAGGRIVAVGTTTVRALETCGTEGELRAGRGRTALFIQPPFTFRVVDALVTNFHLPQSTLLALVFAFAGRERVLAAYQAAIREHYRFYSYGDAMLIHEAKRGTV